MLKIVQEPGFIEKQNAELLNVGDVFAGEIRGVRGVFLRTGSGVIDLVDPHRTFICGVEVRNFRMLDATLHVR